jgi:hypothetical protein
MEPVTTLAATAIGVLTPYVAKGAEEFIKAAGKDVYEKAKQLFAYVKGKLSGNEEASATISLYERNPARHGEALKGILAEELEKDKEFKDEVSRQLEELGPYIHVIQKMEKGEGVKGVDAEEIEEGRINVEQDIKEAKDVTGVSAKRIGRKRP